ncbi:MAG: serine protease AprX [Acidimicrobiaceae bacterium]|jgi:serine protease AprX|nr:serine protease AprX [Acidimicrobiaceae bacterium]
MMELKRAVGENGRHRRRTTARLGVGLLGLGLVMAAAVPSHGRAAAASTDDRKIEFSSLGDVSDTAASAVGSSYNTARLVGAPVYWLLGDKGQGVGVAVIDTGVEPGPYLPAGRVIAGPDFSGEGNSLVDHVGHGTHMAGIIAGSDPNHSVGDVEGFNGIAPAAFIVSVKVADSHGRTDAARVIAAIDWVTQTHDALGVRVVNLSLGTTPLADYRDDPIAAAVERAWDAGLVVVTAAGNHGDDYVDSPAYDPHVIAVGATDTRGTVWSGDDTPASFSSVGDARRPSVTVFAPGRSVQSILAAGANLDGSATGIGDGLVAGTGTSQAAAVVSGAVALELSHRAATPVQIKALFGTTASRFSNALRAHGAGRLNLTYAFFSRLPGVQDDTVRAKDYGNPMHITSVLVDGRYRVTVAPWTSQSDATTYFNGVSWSGVSWSGVSWSGISWSGISWSGISWSGISWSGAFDGAGGG